MDTRGISSKSRIPELDGVRGLAIISVLYWHYFVCLHRGSTILAIRLLERVGQIAWAGVDLFFVLSGFLIGGILIDNRESPNVLRAFYARRTFRIFPLYFLWLGVFVALVPIIGNRFPWLFSRPLPIWSYISYTQNLGYAYRDRFETHWLAMTWSLAVEEQFYILLPLAMVLMRPRLLVAVSTAMVFSSPAIRYLLIRSGHSLASYVLLPARWDSLFAGVLLAYALRRKDVVERFRRSPWLINTPMIVGFCLCLGWICFPGLWRWPLIVFQNSVLALASASIVLFAVMSPYRGILRSRGLVWMGGFAYGIYMFHQSFAGLVFGIFGRPEPSMSSIREVWLVALSLLLTLSFAFLSYKFFERPLIRIGQRFTYAPSRESVNRAEKTSEGHTPIPCTTPIVSNSVGTE